MASYPTGADRQFFALARRLREEKKRGGSEEEETGRGEEKGAATVAADYTPPQCRRGMA
jgi:hypothetical protein